MGLELGLEGKEGVLELRRGEVRAFSWQEECWAIRGRDPGLEGPRLPGVEGLEGSRAVRMSQLAGGPLSGVCTIEKGGIPVSCRSMRWVK